MGFLTSGCWLLACRRPTDSHRSELWLRVHRRTHTQDTTTQLYNITNIHWFKDTITESHKYYKTTQQNYTTKTQWHNDTMTQRHNNTKTQQRQYNLNETRIIQRCENNTTIQLLNDTTKRNNYTMTQGHNNSTSYTTNDSLYCVWHTAKDRMMHQTTTQHKTSTQ